MIAFPHAKINLGLSIISKRQDGFHNIETIFYPLPLRDVLEIIASKENCLFQTGLPVPGKKEENLVQKAFLLLKNDYPPLDGLDICLHKAIPMGAGLGGGSSDAAFALKLITRFFELPVSRENLARYAVQLGSDCPFFLQDSACYATGRGENLEPMPLDLSPWSFLLVHPEIRIGTAWAYSQIQPREPESDLRTIVQEPVETWKNRLVNDFEVPVFKAHPSLQEIKQKLYGAGALYASMSGSGSSLFGIFRKGQLPDIRFEQASQTYLQ